MATVLDRLLIILGVDSKELEQGLDKAEKRAAKTDAALTQFGNKGIGMARSLITRLAAPIAGAFAVGKIINSYTSDVANVARMTGAYSQKLEEWKYKRAMLSRITKEDIELYKKSREALVKFNIAMQDMSAKIMREISPAIKFFIEKLNKFSDWVDRNQNNIIRFLKVTAVVITTALIPAFVKLTATMLRNPLTWLIALLAGLALVLDDLVVYLQGGQSQFDKFWKALGLTKGDTKLLNDALGFLKDNLGSILGWCVKLVIGFKLLKAAFKLEALFAGGGKGINFLLRLQNIFFKVGGAAKTVFGLLVTGIKWVGRAFMANPIGFVIGIIIMLLMLLWENWDKVCKWCSEAWEWFCGKFPNAARVITDTVSSVWGFIKETWNTICDIFSNVIDFICNVFTGNWSGAWENIKNIFSDVWDWICGLVTGVLNWILGFFGTSLSELWEKISGFFEWVWDGITGFFSGIVEKIRANHARQQAQFKAFVQGIKNVFKGIKNWFKSLWKKITGVFSDAIKALKNKLKEFVSFLPDSLIKKLGLEVKEDKEEPEEKEEEEKDEDEEPEEPAQPPAPEPVPEKEYTFEEILAMRKKQVQDARAAYAKASAEERAAAAAKDYSGDYMPQNDLENYYKIQNDSKKNRQVLQETGYQAAWMNAGKEQAQMGKTPAMNSGTAASVRNSTTNSKVYNDNSRKEVNINIQGNADQSTVGQIKDGVSDAFASGANSAVMA